MVLACEVFDGMCMCVIPLNYQVDVNDYLRHIRFIGFVVFLSANLSFNFQIFVVFNLNSGLKCSVRIEDSLHHHQWPKEGGNSN